MTARRTQLGIGGLRMEKVREALKLVPPHPGVLGEINEAILAAALAEVEEWEARMAEWKSGERVRTEDAGWKARLFVAEQERDQVEDAILRWNVDQYDHDAMDALADIAMAISSRRTRTGDGGVSKQ